MSLRIVELYLGSIVVVGVGVHEIRMQQGMGGQRSSYWRRCILWMISRQSLNTRLMFSVSTAHVK